MKCMMYSVHASLHHFQTQQEQAVFIWQEVGKPVARVQKRNTGAKGQFTCTPNLKLSTEKLTQGKGERLTEGSYSTPS